MIIDSGGTSSEWILINRSSPPHSFVSAGMNPVRADLDQVISDAKLSQYEPISKIYFYGAGCTTDTLCDIVRSAFKRELPNTSIEVTTDLLAACRSSCQNQGGIVSIIGTGSNTCRYDGQRISDSISSGGYLIGDEGSGFTIGQAIIRALIRDRLSPQELALVTNNLTKQDLLNRIYQSSEPNTLIASFAACARYFSSDKRSEILLPIFTEFIQQRILPLDPKSDDPLFFIGSIAFHYQKELREALNLFNLHSNHMEKSPMPGLIDYHIRQNHNKAK